MSSATLTAPTPAVAPTRATAPTKAALAAALADDTGTPPLAAGREATVRAWMRGTRAAMLTAVTMRVAAGRWTGPAGMTVPGARFEVRPVATGRPVAAFTDPARAHGCRRALRAAHVVAVGPNGRPL